MRKEQQRRQNLRQGRIVETATRRRRAIDRRRHKAEGVRPVAAKNQRRIDEAGRSVDAATAHTSRPCARGATEQTGTRVGTRTDAATARILGATGIQGEGVAVSPMPPTHGVMAAVLTLNFFPMAV